MTGTLASPQQQMLRFGAVVAACWALGLVAVQLLTDGAADPARAGARLGVTVAASTGLLALEMKRRALKRSVNAVMGTVVGLLFLRLIAAALSMLLGSRAGLPALSIILGFFGEYFVLQAVEIRFAISLMKQPRAQSQVAPGKGES